VDFGSANVGGDFEAKEAHYESEAEFNALKVGGAARFNGAEFKSTVIFRRANITDLFLGDREFHKKQIVLDGLTYKRIFTGQSDYRDHEKLKKILGCMDDYCPQPYKQLESHYLGIGYRKGADEIFLQGKESEREVMSVSPQEWLLHLFKLGFLEKFAGYGRFLGLVVWVIIVFIAMGTVVFSRPRIFKGDYKISIPTAIWYSLGSFLPFVTLGTDKFHEFYKGAQFCALPRCLAFALPHWVTRWFPIRVEFYYYFHQLCGYILFSIAFAAMAGIIKVDYF